MKKIILFLSIILLIGISSCKNFDIDHPDFDYTSGYFPYQFPVRTLVLGDYIYDNSNDNAYKFIISVGIGGVYQNEKNRRFTIEVDNSLCNNAFFNQGGDPVVAMPENYYELNGTQIVVPQGKVNGGIEVQLTEAFFNDPDAIKNKYVVPIRLVSSNDVDTILSGKSSNPNADVRDASQWEVSPKNFTMFAVKYINEFHGTYFRYGNGVLKDNSGRLIEAINYDTEEYVENYPTIDLITAGRNKVSINTFLQSDIMRGALGMMLTFEGNSCTVTAPEGSPYTITGSGEFLSKEYNWGNKERDGIELEYIVSDGTFTYEASDIFVLRDRSVSMELYSPSVY
jgi:hypothetical protein